MPPHGRTHLIARSLRAVHFALKTRDPWTWAELADSLECDRRNVYRWIQALEANQLIQVHGHDRRENGTPVTLWIGR